METYPPFLPRLYKHEVKMQKFIKDLTGNDLKFEVKSCVPFF